MNDEVEITPSKSVPKSTPSSSSGEVEVRLCSFNVYDDGTYYAVYQPGNKAAGVKLVRGVQFAVGLQKISQGAWNSGLEPTKEALAEAKHLLERNK